MKNFYLKIVIFIAILLAIYISIYNYNSYTQTTNFQILNERQSIIVQLSDGEYIEIIAKNDSVTDGKTIFNRPYPTNTKVQKSSNLENSIAQTNMYLEYIENGNDFNREVKVTPKGSTNLNIWISTNTAYQYVEELVYNIQMDYTNKVEHTLQENGVTFKDKGCTIQVQGKEIQYSITENKQTIVLSKKYEPKLIFNVDLNINCKN